MAEFLDWAALEEDAYLKSLPRPWFHAIQAGYYAQSHDLLKDMKHEDAGIAKDQTLFLLNTALKELEVLEQR
jgi:hypothetical protein